jgi:aryl-alcohol dehydrogenase-like predicted oxidoreductase
MLYTKLGNTGIDVSQLCLGTMTFGRESDDQDARRVLDRAIESGVNFFDCADVYSGGKSEKMLGEFLAGRRDEMIITSKCGFQMGEGVQNRSGLSRRHMVASIEASLKRLGTDYIDIYFAHYLDPEVPIESVMKTMDELVCAGKIRYFGVSNWSAWQVMKAIGISERHGWHRISCVEPMYSLVKRQAEVEIFPLVLAERLGVISYSPLGGGLLTGKYSDDGASQEGRLVKQELYQRRYNAQWMKDTASDLKRVAEEMGCSPVTLAVAWAMRHPAVTAPIIGGRTPAQLEPALDAADFEMDEALYERLKSLSMQPASATDRNP